MGKILKEGRRIALYMGIGDGYINKNSYFLSVYVTIAITNICNFSIKDGSSLSLSIFNGKITRPLC